MTCKFRDLATGMAGTALIAMAVPGEATAAVMPPDYRGAPNSVFAVFEPTDTTAGFSLVDFDPVGDEFPLADVEPGFDGEAFVIPNFIDPLPVKLMRISLECFTSTCGGIQGNDIIITPVDDFQAIEDISFLGSGQVLNGQSDVTGSVFFDFRILPNPDWETVFIPNLAGAEIERITIDTVSRVPLPAALPLFALALAGLGFAARRRAD